MEPQFVIDVVIIVAIYDLTKSGIKCLFNAWLNNAGDDIIFSVYEDEQDK